MGRVLEWPCLPPTQKKRTQLAGHRDLVVFKRSAPSFPGAEPYKAVREVHIVPGQPEQLRTPGRQMQIGEEHNLVLTLSYFINPPEVSFRRDVPGLTLLSKTLDFHEGIGLKVMKLYRQLSLLSAKLMLEKSGYSVSTATNGQEALKLLLEQDFDIILMDIQMPIMDGVEATKAIRGANSLGTKSSIPIIAMTAYAMLGDREKFLAAGMNDYIAKPVAMPALKETVERVLTMGG